MYLGCFGNFGQNGRIESNVIKLKWREVVVYVGYCVLSFGGTIVDVGMSVIGECDANKGNVGFVDWGE